MAKRRVRVPHGTGLSPRGPAVERTCARARVARGAPTANMMLVVSGSNRKPAARKGKVQLIDASGFWQKMRKSLGSKRKELSVEHIDEITKLFGNFKKAARDGVPISRIFKNADFGYHTITVERPLRDESGKIVLGAKGKLKGKPFFFNDTATTEN